MEKEKTINENVIRVKGKFPIENQLELGQDLVMFLKGGVDERRIKENYDGSVDITYIIKPLEIKIIDHDQSQSLETKA